MVSVFDLQSQKRLHKLVSPHPHPHPHPNPHPNQARRPSAAKGWGACTGSAPHRPRCVTLTLPLALSLARTLAWTEPSLSPDPYLTLSSAQSARVPCSVFSDGLMLRRGPFRPWSEAAPFVREAMAGYLPYELKQARPDGLPEPQP